MVVKEDGVDIEELVVVEVVEGELVVVVLVLLVVLMLVLLVVNVVGVVVELADVLVVVEAGADAKVNVYSPLA